MIAILVLIVVIVSIILIQLIQHITSNAYVYAPPRQQTSPQQTSQINTESAECLKLINDFRAQQGQPPLTYNSAGEQCANDGAKMDAAQGVHRSMGTCPGVMGQCECPGFGSLKQCIDAYVREGPGGGHYEILRNPNHGSVSCGKYAMGNGRYFYTHNFYGAGRR